MKRINILKSINVYALRGLAVLKINSFSYLYCSYICINENSEKNLFLNDFLVLQGFFQQFKIKNYE
jgi:hypothetical protein